MSNINPMSNQTPNHKPKNTKKNKSSFNNFILNIVSVVFLFVALGLLYSNIVSRNTEVEKNIALSQVAQDIKSDQVVAVQVRGEKILLTYATSTNEKGEEEQLVKESRKELEASFLESLAAYGLSADDLQSVKITIEDNQGFSYWFMNLAPFLLPLIFVFFLIWYLSNRLGRAGAEALSFGQSNARMTLPSDKKQKVTFKDVAGAKEAKEELKEIVDFLRTPKKFFDIGARIPKGILLMGAPGTGKTLLARAVAGEANVAFFSISGSEFVEMFVGVGASRVRDLFAVAKKNSPAIIFIDEIDAVGRARGVGMGGGNDEREQTLNQILVEMDGFEPTEKVIVMAATNRPDVLDPAILRPGRFDRRVTIDLPDRNDREEIIKIQSAGKPLAEDVNISLLAERTPGFSGADLYSLVNEAAILAAREDRTKIAQFDLIRSIEKVMLGPERKSHLLTTEEKNLTAYHEAGHALVASVLPKADPVHKISIISRGRAGGYTLKLPLQDKKLQSREEFLDDITMSLGGYITEKLILNGDVTTGPSNDLQVATALARDMVTKYGMSEKLGAMAFESRGQTLFGKGVEENDYSDDTAHKIDEEVEKIMKQCYARAEKIITDYRATLDVIANRLIGVETIEKDEFENILKGQGIEVKQK